MKRNLRATLVACTLGCAAFAAFRAGDAAACTTANLTNYGNDVLAFPQAYAVYWGWSTYGGSDSVRAIVEATLDNQLDWSFGMGGTRWTNIESQYGGDKDYEFGFGPVAPVNANGILVGKYNDEHNLPAGGSTITDAQIAAEADYLMANNVISVYRDTNIVMMLPPGFQSPVQNACGRHIVSPAGNLVTWIPYPDATSGCTGRTSQGLTHELMESAIDPLGWLGQIGWTQANPSTGKPSTSCEIGDLCAGSKFQVQVQPEYNGAGLPSQITTQTYWSNELGGCAYARSTSAYIFGIGTDHKLWAQFAQSDTSSSLYGWNSWGSPNNGATNFSTYQPGATSWGAGRVDVFAVDTSGLVDHAWLEGGSSLSWETLPPLPTGFVASAPDAVSWGAGNVQVFVKGSSFSIKGHPATTSIWSNTYELGVGWSGWTNWANQQAPGYGLAAGVQPWSKISVASAMATNTSSGLNPTSVQQVFYAFFDRSGLLQLGYTYDNQMFSMASVTPTWNGSPIALAGDPEIAIMAPGSADVFIRDTSGQMYLCYSGDMVSIFGATSGPATCFPLGGNAGFQTGIGAAGMGDGRLLVVGRGASGTGAFAQFYTPTGSTGWLGGSSNGALISGLDVAAY